MSQFIEFALPTSSLSTAFDGPQLTSDGGLCWLSEADTALDLCTSLAACIPDWRSGPVHHSLETLVRQRVFQNVPRMGYRLWIRGSGARVPTPYAPIPS